MYSYKIFEEERFILVTFTKCSINDIFNVFNEIRKDPAFSHGYNGMIDFRNAEISLEISDLQTIAFFIHDSPWVKGSWVILHNKNTSGDLSMIYKELTHAFHSIEVLYSIEEASRFFDFDLVQFYEQL